MRRLLPVLALVALAAPAPASAQDLADQCAPIDERLETIACHGGDVLERDARALCRRNVSEDCQPATSEAAISAFEESWTRDALAYQHALGDGVPFRNAPWLGTHNSFNSIAEMGPALSTTDANQQLSLVEQLRVGVRSLELDLHWVPNPWAGGFAPVVCHGQSGAGCSVEKPLADVLPPIGDWLRAHPSQVLLLYLENQLGGEQGSSAAAAAVEAELGDLVLHPSGPPGECLELPLDRSRRDVLDAGAQVVIVSNCGAGAAWRGISFGWGAHEETRPRDFGEGCDADFDRATFDATLIRYYEDDTWLTAGASNAGAASRDDGIDAGTAAAMARCGVDLLGFDHLTAADPRHAALVWSWAEDEPTTASCAVMREDGRWESRPCGERHRFACRDADGDVTVAGRATSGRKPPRGCGLPRTGWENAQVAEAADGREVWLPVRAARRV